MFRLMIRLGYSLFIVELVLRALTVWFERHSPSFLGFRQITVGLANDVFVAGAYGRTASPEAFLGHPAAREILVGT